MKKVLICGFYGNYNLGDEAMLSGIINLLQRQNSDLDFTVLSDDPQDTKKRFGVESVERQNGRKKVKAKRLLEFIRNRYFILGGGDLLRDTAKYSIAKTWLEPLERAIAFQARTITLGISVGEIVRPETKMLIPRVLNKVDFIGVRDKQSKQKLTKLGVNKTIHVTSDLALEALPTISAPPQPMENRSINIGISVRHLKGRGPSVDLAGYSRLQKEIAAIADFLVEKYQATIHFLPLRTHKNSYHPTDDDYVSILEVLRYSRNPKNFIVHRYFHSLENFYQLTSQLDLTIGMRLHSLIIAAGLGVPIIAAQYDPKVGNFMKEIAQSHRSIPLESFELERVAAMVETIFNDTGKARKEIEVGVKNYRKQMQATEAEMANIFS